MYTEYVGRNEHERVLYQKLNVSVKIIIQVNYNYNRQSTTNLIQNCEATKIAIATYWSVKQ